MWHRSCDVWSEIIWQYDPGLVAMIIFASQYSFLLKELLLDVSAGLYHTHNFSNIWKIRFVDQSMSAKPQ